MSNTLTKYINNNNLGPGIDTIQEILSTNLPNPTDVQPGTQFYLMDLGVTVLMKNNGWIIDQAKPKIEHPERISSAVRTVLSGSYQKTAISFIGHSIVYGQNTGATEAERIVQSLPARVSARLNAYTGTSMDTGVIFCEANQQSLWTLSSASYFGGFEVCGNKGTFIFLNNSTASATITLTGTSVWIYTLANIVGVSLRYSVDGAATQTAPASVSNITANGWHYYAVQITGLTPGSHTIQIIGGTSGQFALIGAEGRNSSTGIVVNRCAVPGMTLVDLLACSLDTTDTKGPASWLSATIGVKIQQVASVTKLLGSAMTILMFDVNDLIRGWSTYSYTLDDHKRHLKNALSTLSTLQQSTLVVFGPWLKTSSYATGCPYTQDDLARVYREAVKESTNAAFLDIRTPLYSRQSFNSAFMDYYVHPTALGANSIGALIADAIIDAGSWF